MQEKEAFDKKFREDKIAREREDAVYAAEEFEKIKKIESEEVKLQSICLLYVLIHGYF